jgi:hypothetical protein
LDQASHDALLRMDRDTRIVFQCHTACEAAVAFARQDPYAVAGFVESIEIIALASRFQAHRIDPMTR